MYVYKLETKTRAQGRKSSRIMGFIHQILMYDLRIFRDGNNVEITVRAIVRLRQAPRAPIRHSVER